MQIATYTNPANGSIVVGTKGAQDKTFYGYTRREAIRIYKKYINHPANRFYKSIYITGAR